MSYPILAEKNTWYSIGTSTNRENFTEINIVDSYVSTGNETESWDGSSSQDGSIMIYIEGTKLTIAGNGSGGISLSENMKYLFANSTISNGKEQITSSNNFKNVITINGLELFDTSSVINMEYLFAYCESLTSISNINNWNTSNVTTMADMFYFCKSLTTLDVSNWDVGNVTNMARAFNTCQALTTLDVSNWDVSNVTTMSGMFYFCKSLTTLDVSNWDVGNVTTMGGIFQSCISLTTLNVSNWDVSNVTNMNSAFKICDSLTTLDVSNWDVGNVTTMGEMFQSCDLLTTLDVSNWNVSNVTNMNSMFYSCKSLTTLDVSNWDVGNVAGKVNTLNVGMYNMFYSCNSLTTLDVSNWDVSNVTTMSGMFQFCNSLTNLDVSNWDVSNVNNMSLMFNGCSSLVSLDLNSWDVSKVVNMNTMFKGCKSLVHLDIDKWQTDSLKTMNDGIGGGMFYGCSSLVSLDLSGWNVSKVTIMQHMFRECLSLTTLNISTWDTSKVTDMSYMFAGSANTEEGRMKLTNLDVSKWDTSSCTKMQFMFYACAKLGTIDVSNWDVSKVKNFDHMFAHSRLVIDVSKWYTPSATNMNAMFHTIYNEELDVSSLDTSNVQFFCQMFERCINVKHIWGLDKFNTSNGLGFDAMFDECHSLKELNLISFDTRKAKDGVISSSNEHKTATLLGFFGENESLEKIILGENFSFNGDGTTTKNSAILPTPNSEIIQFADGYWYDDNGNKFTADQIHNQPLPATYYATSAKYRNEYLVKEYLLTDIADTIREINGTTKSYKLNEMPTEVRNIAGSIPANPDEPSNGDSGGKTYEEGVEDGKKAQYDDFWSNYMKNILEGGDAYHLFAGSCWNSKTFYPKYDIIPKGSNFGSMFQYFSWEETPYIDLAQRLEDCGVKLDFSQTSGAFGNTFSYCYVTRLPKIDMSKTTYTYDRTFRGAKTIVTIDELVLSDTTRSFNNTFQNCTKLANIVIRGLIGSTVDFSSCTSLTKDSILGKVATDEQITEGKNLVTLNGVSYFGGIFGALSTTATGQTLTVSKTAVNKAFATTIGGTNGSTSQEWLDLVALFTNWTISLS